MIPIPDYYRYIITFRKIILFRLTLGIVVPELVERPGVLVPNKVLVDDLQSDIVEVPADSAQVVPVGSDHLDVDVVGPGHDLPDGNDAGHVERPLCDLLALVDRCRTDDKRMELVPAAS